MLKAPTEATLRNTDCHTVLLRAAWLVIRPCYTLPLGMPFLCIAKQVSWWLADAHLLIHKALIRSSTCVSELPHAHQSVTCLLKKGVLYLWSCHGKTRANPKGHKVKAKHVTHLSVLLTENRIVRRLVPTSRGMALSAKERQKRYITSTELAGSQQGMREWNPKTVHSTNTRTRLFPTEPARKGHPLSKLAFPEGGYV